MKCMCVGITGLVAALALTLSGAASAAVTFSGSSLSFQPGSGFGVDAAGIEKIPSPLPNAGNDLPGGQGGSLLDVVFEASALPVTFVLPAVGSSLRGVFGSVQLRERFIDAEEIDDLSLSANIAASLPLVGTLHIVGTVTAIPGIVPPLLGEPVGAIDLTISWAPLDVPFGNGGLFRIELDTLNFDHVVLPPEGDGTLRLGQSATVTLLAVPEPSRGMLAMIGAVLVGLYSRRKLRHQTAAKQ